MSVRFVMYRARQLNLQNLINSKRVNVACSKLSLLLTANNLFGASKGLDRIGHQLATEMSNFSPFSNSLTDDAEVNTCVLITRGAEL